MAAVPGKYLVEVSASAAPCDVDACSCEPNAEGWCQLGTDIPVPLPSNESSLSVFEHPGTPEVTVVFE